MNLKFISRIEPRLAVISVLAIAFIGTLSSMTYGFVLGSRVNRVLAGSASLVEVTSGTTARVADKVTSGTRSRDAATSGSTRAIAGRTSGTRTTARSAMTSPTRAAMRPTSATRSVMRPTSGTKTANSPTSGPRIADKSGSRTMAMRMSGRSGMMRPGGPGGAKPATSTLPTTITQLIEQKGLFGRKPQPPTTVSLQGILGESALINGQWIKIGESQAGIKLLELQPNKAVIEFQGQKRDLTLWPDMPRGG